VTTAGRAALGLGGLLVLYGNALSILDGLIRVPLSGTIGGLALGTASVVVAARDGRDGLSSLGLHGRGLPQSLLGGLLLGLVMGLPAGLYFLRPDLAPVPIGLDEIRLLAPAGFLALALGHTFFATALSEEIAFRGLLLGRLRAAFGPGAAILISALAFAAWHAVVNARTLMEVNLGAYSGLAGLAYLGQGMAVFVGGLGFGLLRERSGNLAGCVLAHWIVDVLLIGGLYLASG
jgi:membrane protease YdiL (CAAX protease family)